MRIPEPFFPLINFGMRLTLRSPLHFVVSRSILLLTFTGRRSGQQYTTPVRFVQDGDIVRLFSSPEAKWWRNLRDGAEVEIVFRGTREKRQGKVLTTDTDTKLRLVEDYLAKHPGDASYHGLRPSRREPHAKETLLSIIDDVVIVELTLP